MFLLNITHRIKHLQWLNFVLWNYRNWRLTLIDAPMNTNLGALVKGMKSLILLRFFIASFSIHQIFYNIVSFLFVVWIVRCRNEACFHKEFVSVFVVALKSELFPVVITFNFFPFIFLLFAQWWIHCSHRKKMQLWEAINCSWMCTQKITNPFSLIEYQTNIFQTI